MNFKSYFFLLVTIVFNATSIVGQGDLDIDGTIIVNDPADSFNEYLLTTAPNRAMSLVHASDLYPEAPKSINYAPGYGHYNSGFALGTYYKYEDRVYLNGTIRKSSGNVLNDDDVFTLPEGYRPHHIIIGFAKQNGSTVRLNILPSGRVYVVSSNTAHDWLNLDGISFYRNEKRTIEDLQIGETYAGGIIFYKADPPRDLNGDGQINYGLVAAPMNTPEAGWGCNISTINGADSDLIGDGAVNTQEIIDGCAELNIAARNCNEFVYEGYDDWHLPSYDELVQMHANIGPGASGTNQNIGNFPIGFYWSSTETSSTTARYFSFTNFSETWNKSQTLQVRPIRAY